MSIESGVVAAAKAAAAEAAPSVATIAPLEALLGAVIDVLSGEGGAAVRAGLRLRGYALVGSAALIGSSPDRNLGDLDVVLLSDGSSTEGGYDGGVALWQVYEALRSAAPSDGYDVHFVSANVPIVKVSRADASLDLLWLSGVLLPPGIGRVRGTGGGDRHRRAHADGHRARGELWVAAAQRPPGHDAGGGGGRRA